MKVKFVQIAVCRETNDNYQEIFALDSEGSIWSMMFDSAGEWVKIPSPDVASNQ